MAVKIRLGFVGANVRATWASQSHFPALLASPDVEMTAVCTTRPESAAEAREAFGAKLAFHDYREMAASPEIDAEIGRASCRERGEISAGAVSIKKKRIIDSVES